MKIITIILILIVIGGASCNVTSDNTTDSKDKKNEIKKYSQDELKFNEFKSLFNESTLPLNLDSLTLENHRRGNKFVKLDSLQIAFVEITELIEKCGKFEKYLIFPYLIFEIDETNYGLIYYAVINPRCGFEAYYYRWFLAIHDNNGKMKSYAEVAAIQELWDYRKLVISSIKKDLSILRTTIEVKGDSEIGDVQRVHKTDTIQLQIYK